MATLTASADSDAIVAICSAVIVVAHAAVEVARQQRRRRYSGIDRHPTRRVSSRQPAPAPIDGASKDEQKGDEHG